MPVVLIIPNSFKLKLLLETRPKVKEALCSTNSTHSTSKNLKVFKTKMQYEEVTLNCHFLACFIETNDSSEKTEIDTRLN